MDPLPHLENRTGGFYQRPHLTRAMRNLILIPQYPNTPNPNTWYPNTSGNGCYVWNPTPYNGIGVVECWVYDFRRYRGIRYWYSEVWVLCFGRIGITEYSWLGLWVWGFALTIRGHRFGLDKPVRTQITPPCIVLSKVVFLLRYCVDCNVASPYM